MVLRYRGRVIRESDLAVIRALIEQYPTASRRRLSRELCEIWNWMQPNGAACDMICRGLMLALERAGHIALPPVRSKPINPLVSRPRPPLIKTDTTPIECDLKDLGPLQFRLVRRTPEEPLFNSLIEHHHYLHYTHPVGEQLKYMIFAGERPVACLAWSSMVFGGAALGPPGPVYRLEPTSPAAQYPFSCVQLPLSCDALGTGQIPCVPHPGPDGGASAARLAMRLWPPGLLPGNIHRPGTLARNLLPGGELDRARIDDRAWQSRHEQPAEPPAQASAGLPARQALPASAAAIMSAVMKVLAG